MDANHILLDSSVINLNAGQFGPVTNRAYNSVNHLRRKLAQNPSDFLLRQTPKLLWSARQRLASFLNGDPHRLLFTNNVTEAVNLVSRSLKLPSDGEILLTNQEYQPMRWCWERLAARRGLSIRTFAIPQCPTDPKEIVDAAIDAITDKTRLLFLSHVLSGNGLVLPIEEICRFARRKGITTIVDGAHAPGQLPLYLNDLDCDAYVGSGHKWLLAPAGTGFVHLGPKMIESIEPLIVSWGYKVNAAAEDRNYPDSFGATPNLRRFECQGTRDLCAWLALPDAIAVLEQFSLNDRLNYMKHLASCARDLIQTRLELECVTPENDQLHGAMVSFSMNGFRDASLLRDWLWHRHRVEVAVNQNEVGSVLRVSTHIFNTETEISRLVETVHRFRNQR